MFDPSKNMQHEGTESELKSFVRTPEKKKQLEK